MNQVNYLLPTQETQDIIEALKAAQSGLYRSSNHYDIVATHTSARRGEVLTQRHTLCKKDVLKFKLDANHCEVVFKSALRRAVLFLPYTSIIMVEHYRKVEPNTVSLYCAEHLNGQPYLYYRRGEYGSTAA